jgi:hypothetical protein
MWGKARGHSDRNSGPADGPFKCPLEITVATESEPTAFGVAQTQALHNRCHITWRWLTHSVCRGRHRQIDNTCRADLNLGS